MKRCECCKCNPELCKKRSNLDSYLWKPDKTSCFNVLKFTFNSPTKLYYYVITKYFTRNYHCRCYPVGCQHILTHGSQDQDYPECCGCYNSYCLASQGIWDFCTLIGYTCVMYDRLALLRWLNSICNLQQSENY